MIERYRKFKRQSNWRNQNEIFPDEVFIDSRNLPEFDKERFEGQLERPISRGALYSTVLIFTIIIIVFSFKLWFLQIKNGEAYALQSENNRLHHEVVFSERGIIIDRNGVELAWNTPKENSAYPDRKYIEKNGFSHVLGYVSYPKKDSAGFYYQDYFDGKEGVEALYDTELSGKNGLKLTETNAKGEIESESTIEPPKRGEKLILSIDGRIQEELYKQIRNLALKVGFSGGAGVIMNIATGEIIALSSYPEYSSQYLSNGKEEEIKKYSEDSRKPFLNRVISGVYTPGSIIKPYLALGALSENIIDPNKKILSTGKIEIVNPYNDKEKSVFVDWKAHGLVDMRKAIAVSSNVYFYEIGGGFEDQKGLGITNIEKYMRMFGFGNLTGLELGNEKEGTIPNPIWKADNFNGDDWRLGDTYHTSIGQYGLQVTPMQVVRAVSAIANDGHLLIPTLLSASSTLFEKRKETILPISPSYFQVVREGMRQGVNGGGTAYGLNISEVKIAAKTGTAEIGTLKQYVNSWSTGFFPYENPKYSFAILMERGPRTNTLGATLVMRGLVDYMNKETPEYFGKEAKQQKEEKEINPSDVGGVTETDVPELLPQ
ncbi:MAG: penicillin-binding transpeptidase domain-containing protein [Patescibacteria group bacterium]